MDIEEKAWTLAALASVLSDERIRAQAWSLAQQMREEDDPTLTAADLAASTNYLRTCLLRRSQVEISAMTETDFAGLWALGTLGYARYRGQRAVVRGEHRGRERR